MEIFSAIWSHFQGLHTPSLLAVGVMIIAGFFSGKLARKSRLPTIVGFMVLGGILGPSVLNIVDKPLGLQFTFITEVVLGLVALNIGLELSFSGLRKQGVAIVSIILLSSFGAFFIVLFGLYFLTQDLPLSLMFAALAPATAPAGTVAVIQEFRARGSLTRALYAVVGFDDGLAIIIFAFSAVIARSLLLADVGGDSAGTFHLILMPIKEIILSIVCGGIISVGFIALVKKNQSPRDILILIFGFVILTVGLCEVFHLSLILTNMVIGMVVINTKAAPLARKINDQLLNLMPLLFILFFTIAGTNLHLGALPSLGLIGLVYIIARSIGKVFGAQAGALFGTIEAKVKNNIGIGILAQAGVAIGLSLVAKSDFQGLGKVLKTIDGQPFTAGDRIGTMVVTTIAATSIFFEIVGPILTKVALKRAGEIRVEESEEN